MPAAYDRLAPVPPSPGHRVTGDDQPVPDPGGLVTPDPAKRPRSSYLRFEAEQPNECWQSDFTHYPLADGTGAEILTWLDDHSRLMPCRSPRTTGSPAPSCWPRSAPRGRRYGVPASTLTDNGMVFTTRLSGGKGGRNGLETELRRLGHPAEERQAEPPHTQGKVERLQQTLKKWLRAQPAQPAAISELQALLDAFASIYNTRRPHRSLPRRATPATANAARPKAAPGNRSDDTHARVRTDLVGTNGAVTLRHGGKLYHIGVSRTHARTRILLLIQDLHIRIINAATGELLRELELDPDRTYQPTGLPPGPTPGTPRKRKHPEP